MECLFSGFLLFHSLKVPEEADVTPVVDAAPVS